MHRERRVPVRRYRAARVVGLKRSCANAEISPPDEMNTPKVSFRWDFWVNMRRNRRIVLLRLGVAGWLAGLFRGSALGE